MGSVFTPKNRGEKYGQCKMLKCMILKCFYISYSLKNKYFVENITIIYKSINHTIVQWFSCKQKKFLQNMYPQLKLTLALLTSDMSSMDIKIIDVSVFDASRLFDMCLPNFFAFVCTFSVY